MLRLSQNQILLKGMFKTLGYDTELSYSKSPEKRLCWDSNITEDIKRELFI